MFSNNWNIKYVPKKSEQIIGNKDNIAKIREWLQNYKNNINNGLFISGPHNTGKSLIVNILANVGLSIAALIGGKSLMSAIINN